MRRRVSFVARLREPNRGTLNKCLFLSCFPFYRTSRECRPRKSGEMAESAQIRGELSAGFPGFLRNIPEFLTRANRATGHVASTREGCVSGVVPASYAGKAKGYYAYLTFSCRESRKLIADK